MHRTPATPAYADLHLLTVLAETRSYTQAARRLGISKASVSTRVADLERAIGVPLVRRTTRSVVLTAAGQQLVDDTRGAFERIGQSVAAVQDLAGEPRGLVRLSAPVALGRQHIAPALPGFLRAHPEVRLELDLNDRLVNLAQEGFDLAVRHAQAPPETHVAWTLCASRSLLVASKAYLRGRPAVARPEDLAAHDCLMYLREGPAPSWTFERGGRKTERVAVAVRGPLRANNSEVLRDAVLADVGIGLLPDFSAMPWIERGELVPLLPGWRPLGFFGDAIYAIRPWTPQVPRAVQALVAHLRGALAGGFPLRRA